MHLFFLCPLLPTKNPILDRSGSQERYIPDPSDRYRLQRKSKGRHVDQALGGFRLEISRCVQDIAVSVAVLFCVSFGIRRRRLT
jgi:hypothetical protein